jgi:hypothetical protein
MAIRTHRDPLTDEQREFLHRVKDQARAIASFLLERHLDVHLPSGVSYRAVRAVYGIMHDGFFCSPARTPLPLLLRDGRIINNERRPWIDEAGRLHQAEQAVYVLADDETNTQCARLAGFAELHAFEQEVGAIAQALATRRLHA